MRPPLRPHGRCPFCGVPIHVGLVAGRIDGVDHDDPTCADYDRMDAGRYLVAVQDARKAATPAKGDA